MKIPIEIYNKDTYDLNKNSKEIFIEAYITDSCNYNCHYCVNLKNGYKRQNKTIDLNLLFEFIQWLKAKTNKIIRVTLLGGEPTLHPDFFKFLQLTKNTTNVIVESFTNLSQSESFYKQALEYNCYFKISFHWLNDIRSKKFLNTVLSLQQYKKGFEIAIMLDYLNFDKCINIYNTLLQLDFEDITMCYLLDDYTKEKQLKKRQQLYTQQQLNIYNECCKQNKLTINNNYCVKYDDNSIETISIYQLLNEKKFNFNMWLCNAGKDRVSIDFDGNIHPCCALYTKTMGTLKQYKLLKFKCNFCTNCECDCGDILKQNIFLHK